VAFVLITVALDILGLGIIIPVYPKLVERFLGGDTAQAAISVGLIATLFAAAQFIFSPLLGALSDRFGRRPIILLSNLGLGLDYLLIAFAPTLSWLFIGRALSGITAASIPTASAYIADVTPPKKRAAAFGLIGAAFGIGFVLGPAVGGFLGHLDPRLPFFVAAGLSLANWLYGYFILPESLPPSRRASFEWKKANPLGSLVLLRSHPNLMGMASVHFLNYLAHMVLQTVFVLYVGYRYAWDARAVGFSLMLVGFCSAVVMGGLIGPIVKRFKERKTILAGLFFGILGFTAFGFAPSGAWFLAGIPLLALWSLMDPALNSLMSRLVSHREQGRLQGANNCIRSISEMVGPSIFTGVFAWFIGSNAPFLFPGAPFLVSSLLILGSVVVAAWVTRPTRRTLA
jgi:MFS transporter, DHA1 family, tetracycline resistance protein